MASTIRRYLVGRDPFVLVAGPVGGLLIGGLLVVSAPSLATAYTLPPTEPIHWGLLFAMVGLPALLAWVNDGLLACWLVDFGPLIAIMLVGGDGTVQTGASAIYGALTLAAIVSLTWGSLGFAAGIGTRWAVHSVRDWWLGRSAAGRRSV